MVGMAIGAFILGAAYLVGCVLFLARGEEGKNIDKK